MEIIYEDFCKCLFYKCPLKQSSQDKIHDNLDTLLWALKLTTVIITEKTVLYLIQHLRCKGVGIIRH